MPYEVVIGLEVHAQLKTDTKIFCACSTRFGAPPNQNTCPVCLGLPGALPVLNEKAVGLGIKAGLALGCQIQSESVWDRKNYFYADLPKGYQITQFTRPLCLGGHLDIVTDTGGPKRVGITRIHMEEDAGKSLHDQHPSKSQVDLNRAGIPLVEIVSEPDLRSPEEAGAYLRLLRAMLRYADVCDGNMEEGSLRCDANVSIRPVGQQKFGTKVELKNLNSIRYVEKAIAFEIERQTAVLESGGQLVQETRQYDAQKNKTESMRSKEDAHDYRYFPDPDLVPLKVSAEWLKACTDSMPEMPQQKAARFVQSYAIPDYDAQVLTSDKALSEYFETAVKTHNNPKRLSNWIMTEVLRLLKERDVEIDACPVSAQNLALLVAAIDNNTISGKMAKTVFEEMFATGDSAEKIIAEKGLAQVSDSGALEKIIDEVLQNNPGQLAQYRSGKDKLFGFFVGQVMKASQGQANPQMLNDLLLKKLKS